ncbi:MAG: phosphoribosylformylglycinamidine cyclo-ligase [Candidatus Woykebacteria bacterium]
MAGRGLTYEQAGVSIKRGDNLSRYAFRQGLETFNEFCELIQGLPFFRAEFPAIEQPVLKAESDGVGSKPKYCFASGRHHTIGIDLVAMSVNDLVRYNAAPLFFLDHIAHQATDAVLEEVIGGIRIGCDEANAPLLGGEIEQVPVPTGEYEISGGAVGIADKGKVISGETITEGDIVFGIASNGLHCNGYSLVREVFPPEETVNNPNLLYNILKPTRIYVRPVLAVNQRFEIHGWAHITGGGIVGKLGKIIPEGLVARLDTTKWTIHNIFMLVREAGNISDKEMRRTFNMGLGMIGVAPKEVASWVVDFLVQHGETAYLIGEVVRSRKRERVTFF